MSFQCKSISISENNDFKFNDLSSGCFGGVRFSDFCENKKFTQKFPNFFLKNQKKETRK